MAEFVHRQAAHCESGVMSSLMTHAGLLMSEPMAFGLSAALSFALIPFIKLSGLPLIGYRMPPRAILNGVAKRTGTRLHGHTFRHAEKGMAALDAELAQGRAVGLQTSVFWLPYFPEGMRFHFNAHNLIVYGREGDDYLISDPVFEAPVRCDRAALMKARFAKGALAARGFLYYPQQVPSAVEWEKQIPAAIRRNRHIMLNTPLPFIGVRGIRRLGKQLVTMQKNQAVSPEYLSLYLGHIVRMQEEIGTGGAGFRFMYAAFLRESAKLLNDARLREAAQLMTEAGDQWRVFALRASKMCKQREPVDTVLLEQLLNTCADQEQQVWSRLAEV